MTEDKQPKISVVMSVFNGEKYLKPAVEGVLGQTFAEFEFLIFDDGSTDGTSAILDDYAARDGRIKLIRQANQGLTKTLNKALEVARGVYIARMDCDDVSLPGRFAAEVLYLDAHPEVAVVSTFAKVIDADGKEIGEHRPGVTHEQIKKLSFFSGQLCHPAVMFRKEAIKSLGGYDESYRYAQDYELWFRVMKKYQVANLPEVLFQWRKTAGGIGQAKKKEQLNCAQRAKRRAIAAGLYPKYYLLLLAWPYLRGFVPRGLKDGIKKFFSK